MSEKEEFSKGLTEVSVLSNQETTYGLPSTIFVAGFILTVGFMVILPWYIGVLFGVVYFYVMYSIHETDLRAIDAWVRALRRQHNHWSAGKTRREKIIVI